MNPVEDLENIYREAVREVDPAGLIRSCVKMDGKQLTIQSLNQKISENLFRYRQVIVLGIGKASARMASAMEDILEDELSAGFVITKYGHELKLKKIQVREAGHPVPDENSLEGARILAQMAEAADENTLIINLISGGGSSLFCLPADGISLEDKRQTTTALLASGANIEEMNCIRKHLSRVKGGGLAKIASPARLINLILSDVTGDRIDTIASGITAPDFTTFQDALSIVRKYNLEDKLPRAVRDHLDRGAQGKVPETPKPGDPVFRRTDNIILGNNTLACRAARKTAERLGYHARIISTTLAGEAAEAGACFARLAEDMASDKSVMAKPAALIAGGETTVTIKGKGKGGRNQELSLAFAVELHRIKPNASNIFFLSAGTDGSDGPTDAAGAFVTPALMEKMKAISAQASASLAENDAYHFFSNTGDLYKTGPTYTNVCDIQILVVV
ncbi:MAG TPA: glycerate kinase [Smithella sp.]|nr:glycerate kinase [Smithella sp.]MDM7988156.1 glycerate kinase [Smithella sp.]HNY51506.1 glycerate kinase [Smithella sp.]HOG90678.1 glycerate kinase [Smithella sp.]HOU51604.1 glycerate kinase [Smithella sp.]